MSKGSLRNSERETTKDQQRDEFKIELKKMGNLEQKTAQPPYDIMDGTALED